jgi:hypothetical protein
VKILCLLLAVYVMMLSGKPCCADNDCHEKFTTKTEQSSKSSSKEKECSGCSPFFTCGSCVGFIVSKPITITFAVISENYTLHFTAYREPDVKKIALSVWLPPKIS